MLFVCILPFVYRAVTAWQHPHLDQPQTEYSIYRQQSTDHTIRIKAQNDTLCDARTKQWTGWLSTGSKHLFFWYFDMSEDSSNDESLTLWLTGGPGGSSMMGLFGELGPCRVAAGGNSTKHNPYGWSKATSMLFVDQPVGVGFSYADPGTPVPDNSFTSAADMTVFLQMFISQVFPDKANVPLHLSGESYAGHYLPALGAEIVTQNKLFPHRTQLPLKSMLIGNGFVSPRDVIFGYWETLCTTNPGVDRPVFNETRCEIIAEHIPRCMELIEVCYAHPDVALCQAAFSVCYDGILKWYDEESSFIGGRNPFDITAPCEADLVCYRESDDTEIYLNKPWVWNALDVPSAIQNFSVLAFDINRAFDKTSDSFISMQPQVLYLLANKVDILIYQGNLDLACGTSGNLRWANNLPWKGQPEFVSKSLKPWSMEVGGENRKVGTFKDVNVRLKGSQDKVKFAFVTVDSAGHMVPLDQPEVALEVVNRWLNGKPFDGETEPVRLDHVDL